MMIGETATGTSKASVEQLGCRRTCVVASSSAAPMPTTVLTGTAISATSPESFSAAIAVGLGDLAPEGAEAVAERLDEEVADRQSHEEAEVSQ